MRRAWPSLLLALILSPVVWLGTRASFEPVPEAGPAQDPPVPESMTPPGLAWLLQNQNADGSWGNGATTIEGTPVGETGLTGLALLSFLGAGYSHLSKDQDADVRVGAGVKKGIERLRGEQRADGGFRFARSGLDTALAALALTEAYGMTASRAYKQPAQSAVDAVAGAQRPDGSWGDGPTTAWAFLVLRSAELGELDVPGSSYDRLRAYYEASGAGDGPEALVRIRVDRRRDDPAVKAIVRRRVCSPKLPLNRLFFEARAIFDVEGPGGPAWKVFGAALKDDLLSRSSPLGRSERAAHESLKSLCLQVYYRYSNALRGGK